jgi:hypothetical protein
MKNKILKIVLLFGFFCFFSCEEYLDIAPEANIEVEDVFKNFDNAQGFVEEMYAFVADYQYGGHSTTDWLLGDDGTINAGFLLSAHFDRGNLDRWSNHSFNYFIESNGDSNSDRPQNRNGVYDGALKGIRKANIAIANIDLMVDATQAEKDVILGQAYFFRAFFHCEIFKFWGAYPYIDVVLADEYELPRPLTYKESALAAHEDFKRAATLLPVDWDNEPYGQKTLGENKIRVTKGAAYSFMGKNLLLAASPLMKGSTDTYDYDQELAQMAVDAFAEVLKLGDQGRYALEPFDNYEEVFWDVPKKERPGGTEYIFDGTGFAEFLINNILRLQMDNAITGGSTRILVPTHNFIHNNFGMANGLSIEDDASGNYGTPTYDPTRPFENRDPRFYKWVTVDGDVLSLSGPSQHRTAKIYTGGEHRDGGGSNSGYFMKKFYPTLHSRWNNLSRRHVPHRLHMRYTDVYLMYAEALHAATGNATTVASSYPLSAEGAINVLRDRANIAHVHPSIVADPNKFMDEVRRERSVELSFECHRWVDIRRWVLAHLPKYKTKTGVDFPEKSAAGTYAYFNEFMLVERICEYPKHFWLPFKVSETQLYPGFYQNPGW